MRLTTASDSKLYHFWCAINNQPQSDVLFLDLNNSRRTLFNRKNLKGIKDLAL